LKKLIAHTLLFIHLFSIGGPLAVHQCLVYQSDKLFNDQISKNYYNIDDLIEVRIPVNMPNASDWKEYENLSGQVQFANSGYNYVKMKVTRNAIYLMCIPNYKTTHLISQNIIYAPQIQDIPASKKDHVPFGKINLLAYSHQIIQYKFSIPIIVFRKAVCSHHSIIPNSSIAGPGQPPDRRAIIS
jgi:hypothetical protein